MRGVAPRNASGVPVPTSTTAMTTRRGQGTIEYLLVFVAIVIAFLYGVRQDGPIQTAVGGMLTHVQTAITTEIDKTKTRLGL